MRFLRSALLAAASLAAALPLVTMQAAAQSMTQVDATMLNAGPTPVTGTVCLTAIDRYSNMIGISTTGNGYFLQGQPFCGTLTSGALTAPISVPNPTTDSSPGHGYQAVIYNSATHTATTLAIPGLAAGSASGISGSTWSFDTYAPSVTAPTIAAFTFTQGTAAPPGSCTAPALYAQGFGSSAVISACVGGVFVPAAGASTVGTSAGTVAAGNDSRIVASLKQQGSWVNGATYALNDAVTRGGSYYVSLAAANSGNDPAASPSWWSAIGPSVYLGLVATRGQLADYVTTANTWSMTRTVHVARTAIPAGGLKLVYPNWYVPAGQTSVETSAGSATYKASIEYPVGTMTLCTWSSASVSPSIAGLADATTDWCGPAIPNGAQFFVRTLRVSSANVIAMNLNVQSTIDGSLFGTGTPNDETMSGSGPVGGDYIYGPSAIIGLTYKPSVCLAGDSRLTGVADAASDFTNDTGEVARIIGPSFAYSKLSIPGDTITNAVNNYTNRSRLFAFCSHVIDEYGVNDKDVLGTSDLALVGFRTQLASMAAKPVYGTTIPNETTSTDSWATITNQTISGEDVRSFNALERAGISGEWGVIDVAGAQDPTGIGKWPVSPIPGTTSGAANYATTDGIHETNTLNAYVARLLGYVANWFSR